VEVLPDEPWSVNGATWSRRFEVGRLGVGARIAPFGDGLIVVGVERWDLVAYRSEGGRRWRRMAGPPIFAGDAARDVRAGVHQLVTVGERTLARGGVECPELICPEAGPRLWGVSLGGGWEALAVRSDGGRIQGVFPGRGRFLAVVDAGPEGMPDRLVASRDGRRWRQVGTLDERWGNVGALVGETRDGFVVVDPWRSDGNGGGGIFTSPDGRTWTAAWTPAAVGELEWFDIAVDGDTVMVVGNADDGASVPVAVVSVDGGATWSVSSGWPSTTGGCFQTGAVRGSAAVAAGGCGPAGRAWVAQIPGVPARGVGVSVTGAIDPAAVPFRYDCRDGSGLVVHAVDLADAPDVRVADPQAWDTVQRLAAAGRIPIVGWRLLGRHGASVMLVQASDRARSVNGLWAIHLVRSGSADSFSQGGTCARAVKPAIGEWWDQRLRLDSATPFPGLPTRVLHLVPSACSDQRALRPRVVMLARDALIRVPITGSSSDVGCGDAIRFTVRLPEALGERRIWDASYPPLRPIRR